MRRLRAHNRAIGRNSRSFWQECFSGLRRLLREHQKTPDFIADCLAVFIFTYLPFETIIKLIPTQPPSVSNRLMWTCQLMVRTVFGFLIMMFIGIGAVAQFNTCFSRQNPYSHWVEDEDERTLNENLSNRSDKPHCKLKCDINKDLITGYFLPHGIIVFLSLWMYLLEPIFCNLRDKRYINTLIEKLSSNQVKNLRIYKYAGFSILYIFISLLLSISYLFAFGFIEEDVVIKTEIFSSEQSTSSLKFSSIIFSLSGYVAFDLLYIQVILRYTYQCALLIEYLKSIESEFQTIAVTTLTGQQQGKLKSANTFLKQLSNNSFLTGIVIVIAGFTAFSCIINLMITRNCPQVNRFWQVLVVILRLILWLCIVLFPFYKTAEVNETSHEVYMNLVASNCDSTIVSKVKKCIISQAKLISISIQSSHPNTLLLTILFTIMLGSGIKYINLL